MTDDKVKAIRGDEPSSNPSVSPATAADGLREIGRAKLALDVRLQQIGGCGNAHCIVWDPPGQHTNGGCKCSRNGMTMQQVVYAYRRFATFAAGQSPTGKSEDGSSHQNDDTLQAERDKLSAEVEAVREQLAHFALVEPTDNLQADVRDTFQALASTAQRFLADKDASEAKLTALVEACKPFVAAYNIQPPGKEAWPDERGAREWLPGAWPDTGDFRRLIAALSPAPPATPTSAPVEDVGALVEGDLDWLRIALPKHHPNLHGLNPPEMIAANEAINDRIDRILAALSPSLIQPQPAMVTKPKWRSPETDAELTTYQPADPPPGPPTGPLLVDTTNGQLWRFDMAGRLRKAIGRATAAELAALIQPQGEERCPKCGGTHPDRYEGACSGPPTPSAPPPHKMQG